MKRSTITTVTIAMLVLTGACAGPPDASESEGFANTTPPDPPPPASVVPGSLGGICGVNYINCRTTSTAVAAFTNAARTAVTTQSSISWAPSTPVGRVRSTSWTMYVTRLVNDHSLAQDKLQVALTEFDYGSTWNDSGTYQLDFKRNGTVVARASLIKQNNHVRLNVNSIADLYPTMTVNYRKGAAETLLAWYTTSGVAQREQTAIQNGLDQGANPGIIAGGVPNIACDFGFNGDCFFCKVQKHLGAGILAGLGAGLGVEMGLAAGASMGLAGGGTFVGNMLAELTDCTSRCKSEECTVQWCRCIHSSRPSNECKPEIETCCMKAEGHLLRFTGGICSGHF